jgi:hypothetical protein
MVGADMMNIVKRRDRLTSTAAWGMGWFWVVVLLVLPNCAIEREGTRDVILDRGAPPHTSAVMCDIEANVSRRCATADDLANGVRLGAAAIALNVGDSSHIGLDDSAEAVARCGGPEAIVFDGPFPEGSAVCLNCSVIGPSPSPHPNADAVCVAQCRDSFDGTSDEARTFCESHARASTNFPEDRCFTDACVPGGGMLLPGFADPRRIPEPVEWGGWVGVSATGGTLMRTAPTTGTDDAAFNAGATSNQWIRRGDAYVEFSAGEGGIPHIIGFSAVPDGCTRLEDCPISAPGLRDVEFTISLNSDNNVWILENGNTTQIGPIMGYLPGQRFRVTLTDTVDSPRGITYDQIIGTCTPGVPCLKTPVIPEIRIGLPRYPVRVFALFREAGATLTDVRIVHIH